MPAAAIAGLAWSGLAAALLAVAGTLCSIAAFRRWPQSDSGSMPSSSGSRCPPVIAPLVDKTAFDIYVGTLILVGSLWLIADGGRRGWRAIATTGYAFFLAELF